MVLIDVSGRAVDTAPKTSVHGPATPLHLAFSCHVLGPDGRWLISRRSPSKRTFPGVWTNACCGHPRPGETLRQAIVRHLADELALSPVRMTLALGDFTYRAEAVDGTVEHELCPVVLAQVDGVPVADPDEADAVEWVEWAALSHRARAESATLSPWAAAQIVRLGAQADLLALLECGDPSDRLLDVVPGTLVRRSYGDGRSVSAVRHLVDERIARFIAEPHVDVPDDDGALNVLHGAIGDLTASGGKRLRPSFVVWGHVAAGGSADSTPALDAAAAIELLHTFALLHDDVMDRSATRRGRPTAQHSLSALVEADGAEWFGVSAAVLAGDLAFVLADTLFDASDDGQVDPAHHRAARRLFTLLRTEVIAGQYLDLYAGCSDLATEDDAVRDRAAQVGEVHGHPTSADRRRPRRIGRGASRVDGALRRRHGHGVPVARRRAGHVRRSAPDRQELRATTCAKASARCWCCARCRSPHGPVGTS